MRHFLTPSSPGLSETMLGLEKITNETTVVYRYTAATLVCEMNLVNFVFQI